MERMMPITREDWDQHIAEDDERGRHVAELRLAMFGDPEKPETVKNAVMPTLTRLNNYMDGIAFLCRVGAGIIVVAAAGVGIAHNVGWI